MKFTLSIDCDNAAFFGSAGSDDPRDMDDTASETSRILHHVRQQVSDGFTTIYLHDTNGQPCGMAQFEGE